MTRLTHPIRRATTTPAFQWPGLVICGVDGTAHGREAVRQAAELAGPHGRLELVAVSPPSNRAEFPPVPESAVVEAERALGADGTSRRLTAPSPSEGWIRAAARADLLGGRVRRARMGCRRPSCGGRPARITTATAAIISGLIVLVDDDTAPHHARIAPCSVLRDRP